MTIHLLYPIIILLISCGANTASNFPKHLSPEGDKLMYKEGDCLAFRIDSFHYGVAIVHDLSKDEGGIWYGLLLTDYESTQKPEIDSMSNRRCFGRKIESSLNAQGYEKALDAQYVRDSLLPGHFSVIGNLPIRRGIMIGEFGASAKMHEFITALKTGKQRRLQPPDDYRAYLRKLDTFRPEEYFTLNEFVENQK